MVPSAISQLVEREVARAEESARVLDLVGRACVRVEPGQVEGLVEAAMERACIVGEADGGAVAGLVSLPSTPKTAYVARSEALRRATRAQVIERHRARVAKLRRAVGFSARAMGAADDRPGFRSGYVAMLTLTYSRVDQWEPSHVMRCLDLIRKHMKADGHVLRYVWVAELQKRGALHYHVAIWLPHGYTIPKPDARGWWPHGSSNIKQAHRAVPYLLKYMSKGTDASEFPKGARMMGVGGLDHQLRRARRWLGLPGFIKARSDILDTWQRATGGGWWSPDGTCVPSEYQRMMVGGAWCTVQVADYGRPFQADGAFMWLHRRPGVQS